MTRDDIRKLLGGYATGSLSEAERKILFEAALDDQELFDELAQEQALKETLEEPGAKQRLMASLAPRRQREWWRNPWPWVATAAAVLTVGILLWRPPAKQEVAEVRIPEPRTETPPALEPSAPQTPTPPRQKPAPKLFAQPPSELHKEPALGVQDSSQDKLEAAKSAEAAPVAVPVPAAPAAAPPPPQTVGAVGGALAPGVSAGAARGGGGGGRGVARAQLAPSPLMAPAARAVGSVAARFSFDYAVTPEGRLRIVPSADGFLTVSVSNGATAQVLLSSRPAQAAAAVEVPLPADSTVATVIFAAQNVVAGGATGVAAGFGGMIDPPSGTKTDPAPSPNSRLQAIIKLPPRQ